MTVARSWAASAARGLIGARRRSMIPRMKAWPVAWAREQGWTIAEEARGDASVVFLFADAQIDVGRAIAALRPMIPRAILFGCSTSGEIHQGRVVEGTIAGAVVRFDQTRVRAATAPLVDAGDARGAGRAIGAALAGPELAAVLVLSEGIEVNGSDLVEGLAEVVGPNVPISGGLAGDGSRFEATWVLDGDLPRRRAVAALGLYGDRLRVRHGSQGGWERFGPERRITRAEGNVLYELDGRPALALYEEYLGDLAAGLPATALLFPLAIRLPEEPASSTVRTILAVDRARQSMRFAGDIPQGAFAQLMTASLGRLVTGASDAACAASPPDPTSDVLALAISCIGRRLVMKSRIEEETEAALFAMPSGTCQVGFYAYGEFAPAARGGCALQNQTMTITTLTEV
ncbi:MAG: FIST N-terminal domain-containing protein [Kofleriaceae bacterium]